jgi:hypothetical protein
VGRFPLGEYPAPSPCSSPSLPRLADELTCLCTSGTPMTDDSAPPEAPAQWLLAGFAGLLPSALEDGQLRELQGPPQPPPVQAVVYPPPHYTPVCVNLHTRLPAVTLAESTVGTLPPSCIPIPGLSHLPYPPSRRARSRSEPSPTWTPWSTPPPFDTPLRVRLHHPRPAIDPLLIPDLDAITYRPSEALLPPSRAVLTASAAGAVPAAAAVEAANSGRAHLPRSPSPHPTHPLTGTNLNHHHPREHAQPCTATPYRGRNATPAARKCFAEDGAEVAAQLANAACREVSSLGARQCAAKYASSSAGALACFSSRFSGRAGNFAAASVVWAPDEARPGEPQRALVVVLRMTKPWRGAGARNGAGDPLRLCLTALVGASRRRWGLAPALTALGIVSSSSARAPLSRQRSHAHSKYQLVAGVRHCSRNCFLGTPPKWNVCEMPS